MEGLTVLLEDSSPSYQARGSMCHIPHLIMGGSIVLGANGFIVEREKVVGIS